MRRPGNLRIARRAVRVGLERRWARLLRGTRPALRRALILTRRSVEEFRDDDCLQLAGSVAFHVLLSIFPLIIVVISVSGLLTDKATVSHTLLDTVTTYVPISGPGRQSVLALIAQLQRGSSALGILGLIGVVISAGGMMGSLRQALTLAWDVEQRRPFVRGKALDLLLVLGAGTVLVASLALTVAVRLTSGEGVKAWLLGFVVPLLMTFVVFAFLFRVLPAVKTRFADIWRGALVGALLFQILKEIFAVYLANFAHYQAVYGSLGAAAAFIFFVFLSANTLLFGAEIAAEYPRLPPVST